MWPSLDVELWFQGGKPVEIIAGRIGDQHAKTQAVEKAKTALPATGLVDSYCVTDSCDYRHPVQAVD